MIEATILFKELNKDGKAVVENTVEIRGTRTNVKYEIAALLECLWDIDGGETLCDAQDIHIKKMVSQKA